MAIKQMETNLLGNAWNTLKRANSVLRPSDRGYAGSWSLWGAGYWMASQEPSNMASGMMVAGLAGIGVTKLLKTRFAESAAARHSDTLSDRLTKMAPEVAMDYLDYLSNKEHGAFGRTCASAWNFGKSVVIGGAAIAMTFNAPHVSTVTSSCMALDQATGEMVNRPC